MPSRRLGAVADREHARVAGSRRSSSTTTPRSTVRPAPAAERRLGRTPQETSSRSAASSGAVGRAGPATSSSYALTTSATLVPVTDVDRRGRASWRGEHPAGPVRRAAVAIRCASQVDDRDRDSAPAQPAGRLEAEQAAAEDDRVLGVDRSGGDVAAVVEGAQHVHVPAGQLLGQASPAAAGRRRARRWPAPAGRSAARAAVGERHDAGVAVDPATGDAAPEADPARVGQRAGRARARSRPAGEHLGEQDPVVRLVLLGADQLDREPAAAGRAGPARRRSGGRPCRHRRRRLASRCALMRGTSSDGRTALVGARDGRRTP